MEITPEIEEIIENAVNEYIKEMKEIKQKDRGEPKKPTEDMLTCPNCQSVSLHEIRMVADDTLLFNKTVCIDCDFRWERKQTSEEERIQKIIESMEDGAYLIDAANTDSYHLRLKGIMLTVVKGELAKKIIKQNRDNLEYHPHATFPDNRDYWTWKKKK